MRVRVLDSAPNSSTTVPGRAITWRLQEPMHASLPQKLGSLAQG